MASRESTLLLEDLSNYLLKYQLDSLEELPKDPQVFQRKLEKDAAIINEEAKIKHVMLPSTFYLGLEQYQQIAPSSEAIEAISKKEIFLNWIARRLVRIPNLTVNEFKVEEVKNPLLFSLTTCSAFSLGYLTLSITSEESALQKIINDIIRGPHCLLIKKLVIENSSPNSPPRPLKKNLNTESNIKILFGREKITTLIILQLVEIKASYEK